MKVIQFSNLPSRPPIWMAIQAWIGLKVIDHPGWITGVV